MQHYEFEVGEYYEINPNYYVSFLEHRPESSLIIKLIEENGGYFSVSENTNQVTSSNIILDNPSFDCPAIMIHWNMSGCFQRVSAELYTSIVDNLWVVGQRYNLVDVEGFLNNSCINARIVKTLGSNSFKVVRKNSNTKCAATINIAGVDYNYSLTIKERQFFAPCIGGISKAQRYIEPIKINTVKVNVPETGIIEVKGIVSFKVSSELERKAMIKTLQEMRFK